MVINKRMKRYSRSLVLREIQIENPGGDENFLRWETDIGKDVGYRMCGCYQIQLGSSSETEPELGYAPAILLLGLCRRELEIHVRTKVCK